MSISYAEKIEQEIKQMPAEYLPAMTIAEHKLILFRQIDQMPEELLIELEKIIAKLSFKQISQSNLKTEEFSVQQAENIKTLWNEGIASGCAGELNMQAIREEALRRHNGVKNSDVV